MTVREPGNEDTSADRTDGDDEGGEGAVSDRLDEGPEQRQLLRRAHELAGLSVEELWVRFFGIGGDVGLVEVEAYLAGMMELPALQRDMLAQAVNERLDEIPPTHVPYSHSVRPAAPSSPELTALTDLLTASHLACPDHLPELAEAAFARLGVGVTMYLVDHDQQCLVPTTAMTAGPAAAAEPPGAVTGPMAAASSTTGSAGADPAASGSRLRGAGGPHPLGIDSTLAGRAFQTVTTLTSDSGQNPRMWFPLLDGTERLGVLEIHLSDPADLLDIVLHEQCRHLSSLLGHLVTTVGGRGDALDSPRRRRPRDPSAELAWQLLPPPTAESGSLGLSGWLEPSSTAGGDIFDYALGPDRAGFVLFDAMGHGLPGALLAATAVSAYRSARRNGDGLPAQAAAVDSAIGALSPDGGFVTGFLGELDVTTGRLRYLNAGHPDPLLLRGGRVVTSLTGGRSMPFGLDVLHTSPPGGSTAPTTVDDAWAERCGYETLEPGDWLVMFTDGVTEARDATGAFFGDTRLVDVLQRAAAAGHPPPETARRLAHAVLAHQDNHLQDDATVLLACWKPA